MRRLRGVSPGREFDLSPALRFARNRLLWVSAACRRGVGRRGGMGAHGRSLVHLPRGRAFQRAVVSGRRRVVAGEPVGRLAGLLDRRQRSAAPAAGEPVRGRCAGAHLAAGRQGDGGHHRGAAGHAVDDRQRHAAGCATTAWRSSPGARRRPASMRSSTHRRLRRYRAQPRVRRWRRKSCRAPRRW